MAICYRQIILLLSFVLVAQSSMGQQNWQETVENIQSKISQNKYNDAFVILERFESNNLVHDSIKKQIYYLKTALSEVSNQRGHSIEVLEAATKEFPQNFLLNHYLAVMYNSSGEEDSSREFIDKSLRLANNWVDSANSYLTLSGVYIHEGKWDSTIRMNEYILSRDSDWTFECYNNMSVVYIQTKQPKKGIPLLEEVLRKNPAGDFTTFNNIGMLYSDNAQYGKAINAFERCIQADSSFPYSYSNLGFCYHKQQQYEKAIQLYNKSIELGPQNSWVYKNKAITYLALNLKSEACEYLYQSKKLGYNLFYGNEVDELIEKNCH